MSYIKHHWPVGSWVRNDLKYFSPGQITKDIADKTVHIK